MKAIVNRVDQIEHFIEHCTLEDLCEVANRNCEVCLGQGYYLDAPSPPGLYMTAGYYTHICDCLDEELILDKF